MDDELFRIRPSDDGAARLFASLLEALGPLLPGVELLHVGSTAVPGSLSKGDLDVQLRVDAAGFEAARAVLAARYAPNPGGVPPPHGASFEDPSTSPPVGLHLTVRGSEADFQWIFTEMLREDAALRAAYDDLKRRWDGRSMAAYREEKDPFFARLRALPRFEELRRRGIG